MTELVDRFGRIHDYLRVSLTDRCNLRCAYCMPEHVQFLPRPNLMTADEILQIANTFVVEYGVNKIRLTGGEPLLRKDAAAIIEGLADLPVEMVMTTNGVFLHKFLDMFERKGLTSLNISLDSLHREKFHRINKKDSFDIVWKNIQSALDRNFNIKLNTVVKLGMNDDEVLDFVHLTRDNDLHVRFIEFMPFSGNKWQKDAVMPYKDMLHVISKEHDVIKLNDKVNSTSKSYTIEGFTGTFSFISTNSLPFCNDCNRIRLTADGKLRNCLFSKDETDLLQALRNQQDIRPLIIDTIMGKHKQLGGLDNFQSSVFDEKAIDERSMYAIGG